MHDHWIGMTPRAKLNDPGAIFLAIFLRPFLDKIVAKIGRGITAVTTGACVASQMLVSSTACNISKVSPLPAR